MSTQTLAEAARHLEVVLVDKIQIFNVGQPVTTGATVERPLTAVGEPVAGLVQATVLENAVESNVSTTWSVKVARRTPLAAGQAIKVITCMADPSLVGRVLLIDKVSQNGLAMIRKGVASDFNKVNQQGKAGLHA